MKVNEDETKEALAAQKKATAATLADAFKQVAILVTKVTPLPDINGKECSATVEPSTEAGPHIQDVGMVSASCVAKKPTERFGFILPGNSAEEYAERIIDLAGTEFAPAKRSDDDMCLTIGPVTLDIPVGDKPPYRSFRGDVTIIINEECVM
jgi:hypothetical protein